MSWFLERIGVTTLCLAIAVAIAALRLLTPWPLELLELMALDLRFGVRGARAPTGDIVIVAIDEPSLAKFGRWPWPRSRLAELVERLTVAGAHTIAFDAVFDQRDPAGDAAFATAIRASGRVVLGEFFAFGEAPGDASATFPELSLRDRGGGAERLHTATAFHGPVAALAGVAADQGHVNFLPDLDGGFRRVPLVIRLGERVAPALSVAALRHYLDAKDALLTVGGPTDVRLTVGDRDLPIDDAAELRIDFLGPTGTVAEVSALDVLAAKPETAAVAGKIALIAPTAVGFDSRPTPFSGSAPGVEIHASVIDNLLRGRGLVRPPWLVPVEAGMMILLGLATGLLLRWRALPGAVGALALYGIYLGITQLAFAHRGFVFTVVYPYLTVVTATIAGVLHQYLGEAFKRQYIRSAFLHYVGPEVTELLARDPLRLRLGGERREISILFSDIRGFSTITERLPPEELAELLTEHLGAQTDIVFRHQGLLDKYIGDAIMAFWGAPADVPHHARHACLAALDIVATMPRMRERWGRRGWPLIDVGVGIDTGDAIVGNFGSTQRFSYTAISDHVNTASRLEGLNKIYGTRILISEHTRELVGNEFVCRELDCVRVKGKTHPVTVYELLCLRADDDGGKLAHVAGAFAQAFMAYRKRRFRDAIRALEAVVAMRPDDVVIPLFITRCRMLAANPPDEGWDGVYEALTK